MLTISLIVCLLGLVLYFLPVNNPKVNRVGEIMFALGLFAWLWAAGTKMLA